MATTRLVIKRHVIENVNGTDELFQVPDTYNAGSLWVIQSSGNVSKFYRPTDMPNGFFQISPAPAAGSNLFAIYEVEEVVPPGDLTSIDLDNFDIDNINGIVQTLDTHRQLLQSVDQALSNRVTFRDFNKYTKVLSTRIKKIETAMVLDNE